MKVLIVLLACFVGTAVTVNHFWPMNADLVHQLAGAYASAGATMLGFMLAMLAILVSISDKTLIANMAKTGHLRRLLRLLLQTASLYGTSTLLALVTMVLEGHALKIGLILSTGALIAASALLGGCGRKLWVILGLLNRPSSQPLV